MTVQKDGLTDVVDVLQNINNSQPENGSNKQPEQSNSPNSSNGITVEGQNGESVTLGNDNQVNK